MLSLAGRGDFKPLDSWGRDLVYVLTCRGTSERSFNKGTANSQRGARNPSPKVNTA